MWRRFIIYYYIYSKFKARSRSLKKTVIDSFWRYLRSKPCIDLCTQFVCFAGCEIMLEKQTGSCSRKYYPRWLQLPPSSARQFGRWRPFSKLMMIWCSIADIPPKVKEHLPRHLKSRLPPSFALAVSILLSLDSQFF